jgi:hypothetical protein
MSDFLGFGVFELDRGRLPLPKSISEYVSWLTFEAAVECLAVPLPCRLGGLAVFPPAALAEHREMMAGWGKRDPRPGDMVTPSYELARTGMVTWVVKISKDGRFTLPEGACKLGLLPIADNAKVALVAFRDVFEVWNPSDLRDRIHEAVGRWAELKAQGLPGLLSLSFPPP